MLGLKGRYHALILCTISSPPASESLLALRIIENNNFRRSHNIMLMTLSTTNGQK